MFRRKTVEFDITPQQLEQLFAGSNELTLRSWEKRWLDNLCENLNRCKVDGKPLPALSDLYGHVTRHVAVVCGAGPSLRRLKRVANKVKPEWGLLVTDHALLAVLEAGLRPTLVVTMDGHQETEPVILEGFERLNREWPETPVVTDVVTCPSVLQLVRKPYFFRSVGAPGNVVTQAVQRECPEVTIIGHGGNVGSVAMVLAKHLCCARHVALVGLDCAMQEGTRRKGYWYDRQMSDDHQYLMVADIYGKPLVTMANLHNYKWWADHFCYTNNEIEWINANDGGFLGVRDTESVYNHFRYMTLSEAFDYLSEHGEDD